MEQNKENNININLGENTGAATAHEALLGSDAAESDRICHALRWEDFIELPPEDFERLAPLAAKVLYFSDKERWERRIANAVKTFERIHRRMRLEKAHGERMRRRKLRSSRRRFPR